MTCLCHERKICLHRSHVKFVVQVTARKKTLQNRRKKRASQHKGGSLSLSDRFDSAGGKTKKNTATKTKKNGTAKRRAATQKRAQNKRAQKLAQRRRSRSNSNAGKSPRTKNATKKMQNKNNKKKNTKKKKDIKKKEKPATQDDLDMDIDTYFFKAGKREDPMLGKLDNDMDAYWANKDSEKAPAATEDDAATEDAAPVAAEE